MASDESSNGTLTKAKIVDWVYDQTEGTKKDTSDYVDGVLEVIKQTVESGENLKVSGFGKFEVRHKDERIGRNPKTGREIKIPERKVLRFKVSQVFKDELNGERDFDGF